MITHSHRQAPEVPSSWVVQGAAIHTHQLVAPHKLHRPRGVVGKAHSLSNEVRGAARDSAVSSTPSPDERRSRLTFTRTHSAGHSVGHGLEETNDGGVDRKIRAQGVQSLHRLESHQHGVIIGEAIGLEGSREVHPCLREVQLSHNRVVQGR
jgi:hypothetical protein